MSIRMTAPVSLWPIRVFSLEETATTDGGLAGGRPVAVGRCTRGGREWRERCVAWVTDISHSSIRETRSGCLAGGREPGRGRGHRCLLKAGGGWAIGSFGRCCALLWDRYRLVDGWRAGGADEMGDDSDGGMALRHSSTSPPLLVDPVSRQTSSPTTTSSSAVVIKAAATAATCGVRIGLWCDSPACALSGGTYFGTERRRRVSGSRPASRPPPLEHSLPGLRRASTLIRPPPRGTHPRVRLPTLLVGH